MGQKDLVQKNLEYFPDVFADIINALLYQGEQMVDAEELKAAPTENLYMGEAGKVKNLFQDVSKLYTDQTENSACRSTAFNVGCHIKG